MKNVFYVFALASVSYLTINCYTVEPFSILLKPTWTNLEGNDLRVQSFGGKWILAGSVTFEKKAKDTVLLEGFDLQWEGEKIERLNASLYRKEPNKKFLPIQQNLVCDGTWNKSQQTLTLSFQRKHILGPVNVFYLVLTVPQYLESKLKAGSFNLVTQTLPEEFKLCASKNDLKIAYSNLGSQKIKPTLLSLKP